MKKVFYFSIILLVVFACGRKTNFTISGQIEGGQGKTIYFSKLLVNNDLVLDSFKIDHEGRFKFKGNATSPTFYLLKLSKNSFKR